MRSRASRKEERSEEFVFIGIKLALLQHLAPFTICNVFHLSSLELCD